MLNRRHRFHGYGSLKAVYQHGTNVRGPGLNLRFTNRNGDKPYRVAVVVSRKVSKSAVTRNRIRRRVYEAVRLAGDNIPAGTDLVFTAFNEQIAELPSEKLHSAVKNLLEKAHPQ